MSAFIEWYKTVNPTVLVLSLTGLYCVYLGFRYYLGLRFGVAEGPILSSVQLLSGGNLTSMHKGTVAGYDYNLIASQRGRIIIFVHLHQNTFLHIVAQGDRRGTSEDLSSNVQLKKRLNKVQLEGNFPDLFSLYCTPGAEIELLQLFDPADMAYFIDFCRAYDFELYKDTIYISQAANANDAGDTTSLVTDLENFLIKNKVLLDKLQNLRSHK
jgi:hypothetical protein